MRFRTSIRGVMAVVLLFAVGVAALREADDLWASALFSLTLGILGVAALGAAFRRGRSRASYAGAAAFGWAYMALCFGPWATDAIRPHLATTRLLDYAAPTWWGHPGPPSRPRPSSLKGTSRSRMLRTSPCHGSSYRPLPRNHSCGSATASPPC
jgi:hypothetical protein